MNTLIRYQTPVTTLTDWIDQVFGSKTFEATDRNFNSRNWPRVDIEEDKSSYKISADLPGLTKENVNVSIENGILRIHGVKKDERSREDGQYYHLERNYGEFDRSFALPDEIDSSKIDAKMSHGVLTLTLPKKEPVVPKSIDIHIE